MVHTGNALGMNQNPRVSNDTTQTIMITLDTTTIVAGAGVPADTLPNTYGGNTRNWQIAGSWSRLDLSTLDVPQGATIDNARLIWQTNYGSSPQPTLAVCQTTSINFKTPDGITYTLAPQTTDNSGFQKVANSVDVTTILNGLISKGYDRALGDYAVSKVPISVQSGVSGGSGGAGYIGAGWGLVIFYTHPDLPYNSETLYVGDLPNDTTQVITGFYTPDVGTVQARIFTQSSLSSAVEGDTLRFYTTGQAVLFASGPNNPYNPPYPINNFLSSTICDYLGNINRVCSYGNNNSNPLVFNAGTGVKTEFTITNVPANNYLKNATRSATIFSTGDISSLGAFGLEVRVNQAYFQPVKTSDKRIYTPGETITYTINLPNSGGSTASNVVFVDTLANGLTFVPNSFTINSVTQPGASISGVSLPNISAGASVTVSFKAVTSETIAVTTTIPNTGWIGYNFISDPSLLAARDANVSNTYVVTVFKQALSGTKTGDPFAAGVGDTLTYTIVLTNTGTDTYSSGIFQDTIPTGTTFVPNSVTVDGQGATGNVATGISLGAIGPGGVTTIQFSVKVNTTLPTPNPVVNNATARMVYTDTFGNTTPSNVYTNSVATQINDGTISTATKQVDIQYAAMGETITYTVVLRNTGNVTSNNIVFYDTIPTGTRFLADSLTIDGPSQPGLNPQPPTGANVGNLGPGKTMTLTFKVMVDTVPSPAIATNQGWVSYSFTTNPSIPTIVTQSRLTNSVSTTINYVQIDFDSGNFTKGVNRTSAELGSTLTYTLRIKNTGNTTINQVTITDTIPEGTSFYPNSFTLNGQGQAGLNPSPPAGANIGSIGIGQTATVTFVVTVNTLPANNTLINQATVRYAYTGNPSLPDGIISSGVSNSVVTGLNTASIPSPSKTVDKAFAKVGDSLTYTIVLRNVGNTTAFNVALSDTIPNGTRFIPNSVTLNGVTQPGSVVAPPTGFLIGTLPQQNTVTVQFSVQVETIPAPNPVPNTGIINYSYVVDPGAGLTNTMSTQTSQVTTQINTAILSMVKQEDVSNAFIGDTVNYTITITNTGNTTANQIVMTDTIPVGTVFVPNSVQVNGVTQTGINPETNGVVIPTLPVGGTANVTFKIILDTIPSTNPTPNTAITTYSYLLDPSTPTNQGAANASNTVTTFVNPTTNPFKLVDLSSATIGDTLTYTMAWRNVTNVTQTNVIFVDTLPNNVTFIPNSITINGVTTPGATITPPNGLNTGTLPLASVVTISYKVRIDTIPNPNPIPNSASVTNTGIGTQTFETNIAETQVNYAELSRATKTRDKAYASIGDTITYTIALFNNGNTSANEVVIQDTIPSGTVFEINSVRINGVQQLGAVVAPPTGLTLACIPPGEAATITFIVSVISIPNPQVAVNNASANFNYTVDNIAQTKLTGNVNTNQTTTTIVDATIVPVKRVNKTFATLGDTLTYTVILSGVGNTTANNVILSDSLPSTLTYVPGTFAVNGVPVAGGNPLNQNIGSLTIPAVYTITFNAVVNTVPNTNPIQNTAIVGFDFTQDPLVPNGKSRVGISNTASTQVNNASLGGITKYVDKTYVDCGDTVTYVINIPNSGNVTATNVIFRDTIPNGTLLVTDSVYVNGVQQPGANPSAGITLGNIASGAVVSVSFTVEIQC